MILSATSVAPIPTPPVTTNAPVATLVAFVLEVMLVIFLIVVVPAELLPIVRVDELARRPLDVALMVLIKS